MTWIPRFYESQIDQMLQSGKVLLLYGSRQVGKTSLLNRVLEGRGKVFRGDGQDMVLNRLLASLDLTRIQTAFRGYDLVFIDEAQKVEQIGQALKLLIDHEPQLEVVVSGSSSFDLSQKVGEPLTGRQKVFMLFPVSVLELTEVWGGMGVLQQLENLLVYGCYPETLTAPSLESKREYLVNLRDAFLLKDILEQERVKSPAKLFDLLRLLAYQIGGEVSLNELSNQLGIAKQTVERYLDLLEKVFIIKKVQGFSRNLRKEVTKTHRYYFWDNGIRNAIINNFNALEYRNDLGMLWENFLFTERLKTQHYLRIYANSFFWRTYDQKEVDMVEERDGQLFGFEFKWKPQRPRPPKLWLNTYPEATFQLIHRENFLPFLTGS